MTCARCGAGNPPNAAWCGLCHERFEPHAPQRLRVSVPLARGGYRSRRTVAVLVALSAVGAGLVLSFGLLVLMFMFSLWGSPVDVPLAVIPGVVVATVGLAIAVALWLRPEREPALIVDEDALELVFPGLRHPVVVPRANVRLVVFDERPMVPFTANERFPVRGDLSSARFTDALDRLVGIEPPVVHAAPAVRPPAEDPADPDAGWAMVGAAPPIIGRAEEGWLYRPDGGALPLFVLGVGHVPNVAVLFREPIVLHRSPWARLVSRAPVPLGRAIPGFMARLSTPVTARFALERWGIVREHVSADDVLDHRLSLPKPLRGWRIPAFAALMVGPMIVRFLFER